MKRMGPRTEPWGTPQVKSEGEAFTSFIVTTLQVITEEGQSKITKVNTKSVFNTSQKNVMIDSVDGSAWIKESQNGDGARV